MQKKPQTLSKIATALLSSITLSAASFGDSVTPIGVVESSNGTDPSWPASGLFDGSSSLSFEVTRIDGDLSTEKMDPLITEEMFLKRELTDDREGENIYGPSVIRIPDWIPESDRVNDDAVYYMYFANHGGRYIRLAWAENIEGPWRLHRKMRPNRDVDDRGVLGIIEDDIIETDKDDLSITDVPASPDVLVDHENEQIVMYFHADAVVDGEDIGQTTFVATSPNGLDFQEEDIVGTRIIPNGYLRLFEYDGDLYGLSKDRFYKAPSLENPWERPDGWPAEEALWTETADEGSRENFEDYWDLEPSGDDRSDLNMRHTDLFVDGDTLHVFYTRDGDRPERVLHCTVDLKRNFDIWGPEGPFDEVLRAEHVWEGSEYDPNERSEGGSKDCCANQLRDPDIFTDLGGQKYMFYTGQGEDAIGIARLDEERTVDLGDRWSANGLLSEPQFVVFDLGAIYDISEVTIHPQSSRDYQYTVEISDFPSSGYSTIVDRSSNTVAASSITDAVSGATGRYLRLEIQGAATYTGNWASIKELDIEATYLSSGCELPVSETDVDISDEELDITFGPYDITCGSAMILSMDVDSTGSMEGSDYLNIYYSVDGDDEIALLENTDSLSSRTISAAGITGSLLEVRIHGETSNGNEIYGVSNISVVEGCGLPVGEIGFDIEDDERDVTYGPYDISCVYDVTLSVDVRSYGNLEDQDYVNIYYSIDGGPEIALLENTAEIDFETLSVSGITGGTLEVRVEGETSNDNETYAIRNVSIVD